MLALTLQQPVSLNLSARLETSTRRTQMSRNLLGCGIACVLALGMTAGAQNPPPRPAPQEPVTPNTAPLPPSVTVEGCLVREEDVPGRKPNAVERAGILEDYILTSTKMVKGAALAGPAGKAQPGETPTGTAGTSPNYDVKGIDDAQLKTLVGQRVQIDGTFVDVVRSPTAKPGEDLADIRGTAIRKVPGDCPPKR
jgi:hypothetical protein